MNMVNGPQGQRWWACYHDPTSEEWRDYALIKMDKYLDIMIELRPDLERLTTFTNNGTATPIDKENHERVSLIYDSAKNNVAIWSKRIRRWYALRTNNDDHQIMDQRFNYPDEAAYLAVQSRIRRRIRERSRRERDRRPRAGARTRTRTRTQ